MLGKLAQENLAQGVVNIYNQLEQDMLINIADKLKDNKELLSTDPEAWKLQQLQQLGMLDKQNINLIKKQLGITSAEMNKVLYQAGIDGLDDTDKALQKAIKLGAGLIVPSTIGDSPQILSILKAYQDQAKNTLNLTNQTMLKGAKKVYTDIINKTTADVIAGYKTPMEAMRSTVAMFANQGIPALIDKAGKKWSPEGYVRTVVVTTMHNTAQQMQDSRLQQWGVDLVEVSSHAGARPLCAPYQGRIYRLHGRTAKYPNLYTDTSYGQAAGLFGINCHHMKYPYIEGLNTQTYFPYPAKENDLIYKQSQQQRAMERSIRQAKTRYEMYKAAGDQQGMDQANALIKKRQANMREFIDNTGRARRYDREGIAKNKLSSSDIPDSTSQGMDNIKGPPKKYNTKKNQVPNPANEQHIPQTTATPETKVPEPSIKTIQSAPASNTISVPKKDIKDLTVGDSIKFVDKNGQQQEGIIKVKYTSGKVNVIADDGSMIQITTSDIIEHIPTQMNIVDLSNYIRVDDSNPDLLRDGSTFKAMNKKDVYYVRKYTSNYYAEMNNYLRTGRGSGNPDLVKEVKNLKRVIKQNSKPLTQNTMFYRRFDSSALQYMFSDAVNKALKDAMYYSTPEKIQEAKELIVGGAFEDKAFVSSTYTEGSFGASNDVSVEIHAPQGYVGGMFVQSVSEYSHENEYLFNAGMKFDIQDVTFSNGNMTLKVTPNIPEANK